MTKSAFLKFAHNRLALSYFLFRKLPGAWFMGLQMNSLSDQKCAIQLPFRWRSQNPFGSIYFAAQLSAGEFSTGLLCMLHLQEKPPISMLVKSVQAKFHKKASEILTFTCEDGQKVQNCMEQAIKTGEAQSLILHSKATLPNGDLAAEFEIEWGIKRRK